MYLALQNQMLQWPGAKADDVAQKAGGCLLQIQLTLVTSFHKMQLIFPHYFHKFQQQFLHFTG